VGKPEGNRPLGRARRRWKTVKMDLSEIGWVDLTPDRDQWTALVSVVVHLRFP
jgi:hypothetical protein